MKLDPTNKELQFALDLLTNSNKSLLLIAKEGTGKRTILQHLMENRKKNIIILAPTSNSAVNVGGTTIHSFFQFPSRPLLPNDGAIKTFGKRSIQRKIIESVEMLVINDISMVRADLMNAIDCSLRRNGQNPHLPFGGKQIILLGDPYLLPPVVSNSKGDQKIIKQYYPGHNFFHAPVFDTIALKQIEIQKTDQQTDLEYLDILDRIRVGEIYPNDLKIINSRVLPLKKYDNQKYLITLTNTNDMATAINTNRLARLTTPEIRIQAEIDGDFAKFNIPAESELVLKVGAQVMFTTDDLDGRWVKGTLGHVVKVTQTAVIVELMNGTVCTVEKHQWDNERYIINKMTCKIDTEILGILSQFPLKLAWAATIYKCLDLTFDRVEIDFGSGPFASGQTYAALSRAKHIEGLFLNNRLKESDISVNHEIKQFTKSFIKTTNGIVFTRYPSNGNHLKLLSYKHLGEPFIYRN